VRAEPREGGTNGGEEFEYDGSIDRNVTAYADSDESRDQADDGEVGRHC
jgi:hypothetical protein